MEAVFNEITNYFLNFVSRYSFFISGDYYAGLFSKFFSVSGFIKGFFFVLLVYFSSAEEQKKAGFFKVLPIIAVINSCTVITNFIYASLNQMVVYYGETPDNIISGFILTLVISSCYRRYGGHAFLFGIVTYAALPLLNYTYVGDTSDLVMMIVTIASAGFICLIMSYRRRFFTSWIWYFVFHMSLRIATYVLRIISMEVEYTVPEIANMLLRYLSFFTVDFVIFGVILLFAIVFEKGVLTVSSAQSTA